MDKKERSIEEIIRDFNKDAREDDLLDIDIFFEDDDEV